MVEGTENRSIGEYQKNSYLDNLPIYTIPTPIIEHCQEHSRDSDIRESTSNATTNQETENDTQRLPVILNTNEESSSSITGNDPTVNHQVESATESNSPYSIIPILESLSQQFVDNQDQKTHSFVFIMSDFTSSYIGPPPLYESNPYETSELYEPPPHYSVIYDTRSSIDGVPFSHRDFLNGSDSFHAKASRFFLLTLVAILLIYIVTSIK